MKEGWEGCLAREGDFFYGNWVLGRDGLVREEGGGVSFVLRGYGASFLVCCFEGSFFSLWYTK